MLKPPLEINRAVNAIICAKGGRKRSAPPLPPIYLIAPKRRKKGLPDLNEAFGERRTTFAPLFPALKAPQICTDLNLDSPTPMQICSKPALRSELPPLESAYKLEITTQPPQKTVYKRNIKPCPTIRLLASPAQRQALVVQVELVRSDNGAVVKKALEGDLALNISSGLAVFKRLKIVTTSIMQGTKFLLRFKLKKYNNNEHVKDVNACITSVPIEVFSHNTYLRSAREKCPPPKVLDIIPKSAEARGHIRAVILGSGFGKSDNLRVRFGNKIVKAVSHENGTIIVTVPPGSPHSVVKVWVSNDCGKTFSTSFTGFYYKLNTVRPKPIGGSQLKLGP